MLDTLHLVEPDHPALRTISEPFTSGQLEETQHLRAMASRMREFMGHTGVGLAANQVGWTKRMFLFQPKQFAEPFAVFNPEIQYFPQYLQLETAEEGCLSLPGVRVMVERQHSVRLLGHVPHWSTGMKKLSFDLHGLPARIVQHEMDHLNGILITDKGPAIEQP